MLRNTLAGSKTVVSISRIDPVVNLVQKPPDPIQKLSGSGKIRWRIPVRTLQMKNQPARERERERDTFFTQTKDMPVIALKNS